MRSALGKRQFGTRQKRVGRHVPISSEISRVFPNQLEVATYLMAPNLNLLNKKTVEPEINQLNIGEHFLLINKRKCVFRAIGIHWMNQYCSPLYCAGPIRKIPLFKLDKFGITALMNGKFLISRKPLR